MLTQEKIQTFSAILKEELAVAMGCTEPIAIAYAASILRDLLGAEPDEIDAAFSGNIIKNVKSVIVPCTGGMHGIVAAVSAGVVAACPERKLAVLTGLSPEDTPRIAAYAERAKIHISSIENSPYPFEIEMKGSALGHTATVHLTERHTGLVEATLDGASLTDRYYVPEEREEHELADHTALTVEEIVEFADSVELDELRPYLLRQLSMNMAIAREGISGRWGASIGKTLYDLAPEDVRIRARAFAAAGSDARMSGCELPVTIISGSGNQGITASVPIGIWAEAYGKSEDEMLRALIVSDLVSVHQKTGIGCLSAYCGAISAGCGAGAGICYLLGGGFREVAHTIVNALAILSGTICDGAKPSCAAKIAMAVEAGLLGYDMTRTGNQFRGGEGIVTKGVENTIRNVGELARIGMSDTDREIIRIMLK